MSQNNPSASVIASAIIAIAGSLLALLAAAFGVLGVTMMKRGVEGVPPTPPASITAATFGLVFIFALGVFGIVSAIGLWRLKNWARISFLVFSGVTVVVCAFALVLVLLILGSMTLPNSPPGVAGSVRGVMLFMYGVPLAIGVWWLILFNRRAVAAQFLPTPESLPDGAAPAPLKPRCPLPLAILAGFYIFGAVSMFLWLVMPMPFPAILFGHAFSGHFATISYLLMALICVVVGVGLLRLDRWSYPLLLGYQLFGVASGTATLLNPNFSTMMKDAFAKMQSANNYPASTIDFQNHLGVFAGFGLIMGVAILVAILYYRSAFYAQSDRKFRPAA